MKDLSRDEIEHQVLQEQLKGIVVQMNANFEVVNMSLEKMKDTAVQTLDQAKKTNGRVNILEKDIRIFTTLKEHPWLSTFVIFGLLKVYELIDVQDIWDKLLNVIL